MAKNYLITGYWGEPHVTAENDRGIHAAAFGTGRFVLPVGEQFKAEYIGNNTIRMYDGKLIDNGAAAGIPAGEYVDLLISNAGQGMKRNDLIVFQYSQDASTLIESGVFVVIQGAETVGTPSDPTLTQSDLLSGKATFDQMALWRVTVSGTDIGTPERVTPIKGQMNAGAEHKTSDYWFYKPVYTKIVERTITSDIGNATGLVSFDIPFSTPNFDEIVRYCGSVSNDETKKPIPCFSHEEAGGGYIGVTFMNNQGVALVTNKYVIKQGTRIRLQVWYTKS